MKTRRKTAALAEEKSNNRLIKIFSFVLLLFSIGLYYNTAFNFFSMDDGFVNVENSIQAKGFAAIPEIFTTPYTKTNGNFLGYRPISRLSFALEYQFTANSEYNPMISHIISTILYALAILLLFSVLMRIFRSYNKWFIFLIVLFFTAHPSHTEVVASLKNRDIIFDFIFSFLAIKMFLNWADFKKTKYLVYGIISFLMAFLSKETAIAQLAIFPLILYFFTDMPLKKILIFAASMFGFMILALSITVLFLPPIDRAFAYFENPIAYADNFFQVVASGFYSLGWYLKMLLVPYPLGFYYGNNMLPVVNFTNIWAILSFITYVSMLVYAIYNIKKKTFISFVILYFLVNISMYANIVAPVPGIVGDRFMFVPSLAFSMFFIWLLFKLFGLNIKEEKLNRKRLSFILAILFIIIAPFSYYVHERNTNWRSEYKLYNSDISHLEKSAKANQLFAMAQLELVNINLAKKVNTYEFIQGMIEISEKHFLKAVEVDSSMYPSWTGLGNIYSRIHGNQAKIRYLAYAKRREMDNAALERKNMVKYFGMAHDYYNSALKAKPNYDEAIFNIGNTYELQGIYDSAIIYYEKGIEIQGERVNTLSKLANAYFLEMNFDKAYALNKRIMELNPNTSIPYVNMGNYYMKFNDPKTAVGFYVTAVEKGAQKEVSKLLVDYYVENKQPSKVEYYQRKYKEAARKGK